MQGLRKWQATLAPVMYGVVQIVADDASQMAGIVATDSIPRRRRADFYPLGKMRACGGRL